MLSIWLWPWRGQSYSDSLYLIGLCRHQEFEDSLSQKGHTGPLLQHREPWGQSWSQVLYRGPSFPLPCSISLWIPSVETVPQCSNKLKRIKVRPLLLFLNWNALLTLVIVFLPFGDKPGAQNPSATPWPYRGRTHKVGQPSAMVDAKLGDYTHLDDKVALCSICHANIPCCSMETVL